MRSNSEEFYFSQIPNNVNVETYSISAQFPGGRKFTKKIQIIKKKFSVLIQTDKAIYKPGDNVQYRVLVLDAELKPYQFSELRVEVSDSRETIVSTKDIKYSKWGLYEYALQLADEVNEGEWKIHAIVDSDETVQKFNVMEYQLPDFEVFIDTDKKAFVQADKNIVLRVYARYAFNSGLNEVKGRTNIIATTYKPNSNQIASQKEKDSATFNIRNDLKIKPQWRETLVNIRATFEDETTGRIASKELNLTVHDTNVVRLEKLHDDFYTPGEEYRFTLLMKNTDGSMANKNGEVKIQIYPVFYIDKCSEVIEGNIKGIKASNLKPVRMQNGIAEISFKTPEKSHALMIGIYDPDGKFDHIKIWRIPSQAKENLFLTVQSR